MFTIQVCWSNSRILWEEESEDDALAIQRAKIILKDPTFEGDYVNVVTSDGELVWDSRKEES